jgi:2-hydroxychromene-2-carboxylate isomerase
MKQHDHQQHLKLEPLTTDSPAIVYLDFKSPYAFLAIEPTRALERELGVQFDWRPFVLDIPSYLGSARLDKTGKVVEQSRSAEQWSGVKYAYYDCRRYATLQHQRIRGTEKIWDTNLIATAMLWTKKYGYEIQQQFIDLVFQPFWQRELDVENIDIVSELVARVGADGVAFGQWAQAEGLAINTQLQSSAFAAGIFGVPSYVVGSQLYFGREHLPRIRWQLSGEVGVAPDIANPLPAALPTGPPLAHTITIGVDDSLDALMAVPRLIELLVNFAGEVNWVSITAEKPSPVLIDKGQSRSALHRQWREKNRLQNLARYCAVEAQSESYSGAIDQLLKQHNISLQGVGPQQVIRPAAPGIVVLLDDELFIGRQHLPLLAARLNRPT